MNFTLLTVDGGLFLLRWLHFLFGITWIGLLYYFNFVQGPFFAETDASTKSGAIQKLVPRALWWFRWGAMGTLLSGLLYFTGRIHQLGSLDVAMSTPWGVAIVSGMTLGILMWFNVWFIIWPNQKIVIESATQVAKGGQALPNAAAAGARAGVASRHNVLFSFPMLFFMGASSHLPIPVTPTSNVCTWFIIFGVIVLALEANAIKGKNGPLTSVKGVIHCSIALAAVLYVILELAL